MNNDKEKLEKNIEDNKNVVDDGVLRDLYNQENK